MDGKKKQSIVKRKIDDLIGTISDDDEVPIPSDEEEEELQKSSKKVATFAKGFQFDEAEQVVQLTALQPWDLMTAAAAAKSYMKASALSRETVDQRIARHVKTGGDNAENGDEKEASDGEGEDEYQLLSLGGQKKSREGESDGDEGDSDDNEDEGESENEDEERVTGAELASAEEDDKLRDFFASVPASGQAGSKATSFHELNLSRGLLRALNALNYVRPTKIQATTIPVALEGHDICGSAVTGSGKTAAFMLPILERLQLRPSRSSATRVLVILPTRELAVQCHSMTESLAKFIDVDAALVAGGMNRKEEEATLRRGPDIIIATPGRIIDHLRNSPGFGLEKLEILVLDEADRLLELGFFDELKEILRFCPTQRQTLLFSATLTAKVEQLADLSLRKPVRLSVDAVTDVATKLVQDFVRIKPGQDHRRDAMLLCLVKRSFKNKTLIFTRQKHTAHRLKIIFGLVKLNAVELHGNLPQNQRLENLQKFRDGKADFLICTDVASRGIDIIGVETVINYEMPMTLAQYIHRVGRTARAGRSGRAVSLVSEDSRKLLKEIVKQGRRQGSVAMRSRVIPPKEVKAMAEQLQQTSSTVEEILLEEKVEREEQMAEMQANKATNLVRHRDELSRRPQSTWFQSSEKRKSVKEQAKKEALGVSKDERAKQRKAGDKPSGHRLTRKKRRRMEAMDDKKTTASNRQKSIAHALKKTARDKPAAAIKKAAKTKAKAKAKAKGKPQMKKGKGKSSGKKR